MKQTLHFAALAFVIACAVFGFSFVRARIIYPPSPYSQFLWPGTNPASGSVAVVANTVRLIGMPQLLVPTVISSLAVNVPTADASSTDLYDWGIYIASGTTGSLVADCGAVSSTATGIKTCAIRQGTVTLDPSQKYYTAFTGVSTTLNLGTGTNIITFAAIANGSVSVGGALPATTTLPADVWASQGPLYLAGYGSGL